MPNKKESFYLPSRELRATTNADGSRSISGIVAYNSPSVGLPWTETVAPGAFSDALKPNADILLLRDHKQESLLARSLSKTLSLEDSSKGLKFTAKLPNTGYANDTLESISRGDLSGVSFGFSVPTGGDNWANDGAGNVTRTLLKVDLAEISVTSFAAFPESSVSLRSVPVEYRNLIRSYADESDEDDCECDCPECLAGDCADCSDPECDDPNCCDDDEERSTWKHRAEMTLQLARRK